MNTYIVINCEKAILIEAKNDANASMIARTVCEDNTKEIIVKRIKELDVTRIK